MLALLRLKWPRSVFPRIAKPTVDDGELLGQLFNWNDMGAILRVRPLGQQVIHVFLRGLFNQPSPKMSLIPFQWLRRSVNAVPMQPKIFRNHFVIRMACDAKCFVFVEVGHQFLQQRRCQVLRRKGDSFKCVCILFGLKKIFPLSQIVPMFK